MFAMYCSDSNSDETMGAHGVYPSCTTYHDGLENFQTPSPKRQCFTHLSINDYRHSFHHKSHQFKEQAVVKEETIASPIRITGISGHENAHHAENSHHTDHLEDENHSAPHTLLQNLSSYGQRCLGNNRMLFPEHAVTDSRGNSLVGYSEKPTCFTVLSPAGYAVPFSQKNHEYHYRMLVEARKRQSHPNVIKSVSSTTSSSYKLVDRKQHPLNQDVFDRRLEHTASVDHDENRMQKRKNGIDMNDYSLDESTSSCACEPEESQKTCSTVRRAKKAAKSSCVQINDSRIVSSIPITAEWLQSAMGTRDIQITKLPSDIYHCIYQFVTSQSTHEFATKFLRHDHPDVEFIEQLPGMIYLIHMPMDSKRPPKVGIPFRSYSNSHYASFDRSYPVICKVKEWIDKDDRNVTRLYHFYRGNQKRSVNRKRHHPNNDD